MRVRLRFFAAPREVVGAPEVGLDVAAGTTVAGLRRAVLERWPALTPWDEHLLVAVNKEFAPDGQALRDGDEVAFFPPVSGGGAVRLQREDLSLDEVVAATDQRGAGAVCTFTGVVRGENLGEPVAGILYEVYADMAQAQLERLAAEAKQKFGLVDCSIVHRFGELKVGDRICVVVASSAHRQGSFEACAWVMEELKRVVPIWKRERTPEGDRWR
ncbi:MAG TPA: molybdopterin converting factor subunit 1 [Candidatus Thermoplasmatota archaeon]|jgi:molybdopterin synthase catalytic subunit|nr:molybdopterin converting factor subunit 1 [Candidatus Thermoplasmatota archaeon]